MIEVILEVIVLGEVIDGIEIFIEIVQDQDLGEGQDLEIEIIGQEKGKDIDHVIVIDKEIGLYHVIGVIGQGLGREVIGPDLEIGDHVQDQGEEDLGAMIGKGGIPVQVGVRDRDADDFPYYSKKVSYSFIHLIYPTKR